MNEEELKMTFDITEYTLPSKFPKSTRIAKWIWAYTRENNIPKIRIRQFNYYRKAC